MKNFTAMTRKAAALGLIALCGAVFTGCLTMPESPEENFAQLAVEIHPGKISPSAELRLEEMVVTLAASSGEILRDTITEAGSRLSRVPVRLNPSREESQIIHPIYAVDPSKEWTVTVKTVDARDSVVHHDSARASGLAPRALRNVRMGLLPRFAAYEALFTLPAGMPATLSRVEAAVDGAPACAADADGSGSARLTCDNLPTGNRTVTLSVYGQAGGGATRLLFKGAADVELTAGDAPTETVEIAAADEAMGNVGMHVRIGRVGRVSMNVVMSGALDI